MAKLKIFTGVVLATVAAGCVGYVGPGGGPDVAVVAPDVWVGGVWEHGYVGRDRAHFYSSRGAFSRGAAHGGGGGRR